MPSMTTSIVYVSGVLVLGSIGWFIAGDRDPPPNTPPDYDALSARFFRTSRWTMALTFGGLMLAFPLAFIVGSGGSFFLQVGVVLLGMLGLPVLWVIYQARSRNKLDIDEYLRFENVRTPFLAVRPVAFTKCIIVGMLVVGLACAAALFVET